MDSRPLFALLRSIHSRNRRAVQVYGIDSGPICSGNATLGLKDALFGSFFYLNKVKKICLSYGHRFHQHLVFCPGLKAVRTTGELIKYTVECSCDGSMKKRKGPFVRLQDFHLVHEVKTREILLKAELTATDRERDRLLKDRREYVKDGSKTSSKTSDKTDGKGDQMLNEELYWLTNGEKEKRDKINVAIVKNKDKLSAIRRELYLVHRYLNATSVKN
ncbi:hypothetical protein MAM1_0090c04854 [Mucor ambiguus]|uniref:Uncharacterized protein n=1 Tax=Mucor ambiguus TaxID=91626 RepID=A0A0C9MDJ7_9FUNG|nr:hypothetical protein MAM1_0090c04854 [Mucor ambiguus]